MTNQRFAYRLTKTIKNIGFPGFDKIDAIVQRCPKYSRRYLECNHCAVIEECKAFWDKVADDRQKEGWLKDAKREFELIKGRK